MYSSVVTILTLLTSYMISGHSDNSKFTSNEAKKCAIENSLFWEVYLEHFKEGNMINIILLNKFDQDHMIVLREFADNLFKFLHKIKRQVINFHGTVEEKFLVNHQQFHRRLYNTHKRIHEDTTVMPPKTNDKEWTRILYYSTEPQYAYILIVWDEMDLQEFLDVDPASVLPNTRAMYLILFAYNLQEKCFDWKIELTQLLVRLWKQFNVLNVVAHAPCSCTPNYVFIYKPFHKIVNEWGVIKSFTLEELKGDERVLLNSLKNMNFATMNVSIFERLPTAVAKLPVFMTRNHIYQNLCKSNGFSGMDGAILENLAKFMNFKADFVKGDGIKFGSSYANGTVVGTMGDVVMRRSQISVNGRFLKDYNNSGLEFTYPYFNDPVCIIIHHTDVIPKWIKLFNSFGIYTWLCMGAMILIAQLFWYALRSCSTVRISDRGWLYMLSVLIFNPTSFNSSNSQKLFLGSCLIYSIIINGIFQGNLVKSYSTVNYYKEIDTLQELVDENYTIMTSLDVFKDDPSEIIRKLNENSIYDDRGGAIEEVAKSSEKLATLERRRDAEFLIKMNYTNIDGIPSLYLVEHCPISYFIAFIVPTGSPFLHRFNTLINSFLENGLIPYWYKSMEDNLILDKAIHSTSPSILKRPFSIEDMQSPFFLLLIGLTGSIMAFIVEVYNGRSNSNNN